VRLHALASQLVTLSREQGALDWLLAGEILLAWQNARAKFWELRAAVSRARFWCDRGMRSEAHALVAPLYEWFSEGFETLDLKETKALLDEMAV
jgi:predicted ATPase